MDGFFGGSKSSLHETVKSQQDRLAKYEKKLSDLVKAYKILQEEKKALQETVNVFSFQPQNNCKFRPGGTTSLVSLLSIWYCDDNLTYLVYLCS